MAMLLCRVSFMPSVTNKPIMLSIVAPIEILVLSGFVKLGAMLRSFSWPGFLAKVF